MNAVTNFINDFKAYKEDVKKSKNKIKMIIPNLLTFSRMLAPFFILPAILFGSFPLALSFAIAFAATDAFDGFLARKWNTTTNFGRNLDPVCDKFFILGIIIPFLNNPSMIITLILEGAIASINLISESKNNKPKSTYLGKGKTILLSLLISLSYLFKTIGISLNTLIPLTIITNIVQGATAINYLNIDNKKDKSKKRKQLNNKEKENVPTNDKQNENILANKKQQIRKEIIEYEHLKDTLIKSNEDEIKEDVKRKHFDINKK